MDIQLPKQSDDERDHIANWPMPAVEVGEMIVWLPDFTKPNVKCAGFVTCVNTRSIECRSTQGEHDDFRYDVLHKDDPRLAFNQNMRRNGAWEYAPISARLRLIEADLLEIKKLMAPFGEDAHVPEAAPQIGEEKPELTPEEMVRRKEHGEKIRAGRARSLAEKAEKEAKKAARLELQNVG